jgi:predicted metal-dependent hydrolase
MRKKIIPVRRDLKLSLPEERVCDWHSEGGHVTHFFNALSVLFPAGERFFMDSVRKFRDSTDDADLKQAVLGFIGQEAMHSREHIEYNAMLDRAGLPASKLDQVTWDLLAALSKRLPDRLLLGGTIALEHYTAVLGDMILKHPEKLKDSVPEYVTMWRWHALEETEHKAVAYDVWEATSKDKNADYVTRVTAMAIATAILWPVLGYFHLRMVLADKALKGKRISGYATLVKFLFFNNGPFRRLIPETLEFFKRDFHPWDQDNVELLAEIDTILAKVAEQSKTATPVAA